MSKYFKAIKSFTIDEIVKEINAEYSINIDKNKKILNVSTIKSATNNDVTFLNNYKYLKYIENTKAYACIVKNDFNIDNTSYKNTGLFLLRVENPYEAFAKLLQLFYPKVNFTNKIGKNVVIDETSKIGENCFIGEGSVIGPNVEIGDNVYIGYNVVILNDVKIGNNCIINSLCNIKYAQIGNDCIIHEGVKIGQDGFGFVPTSTGNIKIPQIGGVIIENNVELGSNTCVDRGAIEDTIIKSNTKIDNLVQIAHNVEIGNNCFIAAQTGIAGSSKIGNFVFIGGQSGIGPHLNIENYSQIAPKSGIMKDVKEKSILASLPAMPLNDMLRLNVILKRLVKKGKI